MPCRLCRVHPVPPSNLVREDYRCSNCRNNTTAARARRARYYVSDKRRAVLKRTNAKRIWVGSHCHSYADTVEQAQAIRAHVTARRRAFLRGTANATQ